MRPIATSLPGICLDEKITVSPASSLIGCVPVGDARQRRARLALPAGRDDQHLVARQPHRGVGIDRVGEIRADSRVALRDLEDAVERAPGDAQLAPGLARDLAQRLQPRRVRREGGDQHAPLRLARPPRPAPRARSLSEPDASALKTLVESHTSTSMPSSPIAVSCFGGRRACRSPASRRASSRRCGTRGRAACRSAARSPRGSNATAARR